MSSKDWQLKSNEQLLKEYQKTKEHSIKQELVLRYSYIVKAIAMQMKGVYLGFAEIDDVINEGIIVLMAAIDKFDASKNVKFESYASLRIRGTIIDLARKQDWVPRSVRKKAKEIDHAMMVLSNQLLRYPTDQEIADFMEIPLAVYYKYERESCLYNVVSLDELIFDFVSGQETSEGGQTGTALLPEEFLQKTEANQIVQNAIASLKEKEQLVVSLYYRKEMGMKEIAKILAVSEPRVSQIHSKALFKLRSKLENYIRE